MSTINEIPEDIVESHKGYYVSVYVILQFKTEDEIDNKGEQTKLENDPDEEEMDDVNIEDERERHWRNFSSTMKEVWMRRQCYMLSVGIYISTKRIKFYRVSIRWKMWGTIEKGNLGSGWRSCGGIAL